MRTTLDLPDDLMRDVRIRAASDGRRIKEVVAELLREGMRHGSGAVEEHGTSAKKTPGNRNATTHPVSGLPVLSGRSETGGRRATLEESLALIERLNEEEDLHRAGLVD